MEVTAIVVARKNSERVKNKNLLLLNNETLIERKIRQLQQCTRVNRIVFGSDCDIMLNLAQKAGAEAIKRPDFYCDEKQASANDMIFNMCSLLTTDVVMWSHCTNPLITPKTYDSAIDTFFKNKLQYDSLLSVVAFKEHLWDFEKKPLNYNPYSGRHTPAKELIPLFMQDGGIFIQDHKQMLENKYFFGKTPYLFEIPTNEFLDIDTEQDYQLAKILTESN